MAGGARGKEISSNNGTSGALETPHKQFPHQNRSWRSSISRCHHEGRYKKVQILRALSDAVGDCEFYPVAYKKGSTKDEFLIRNAKFTRQKFFDHKLRIPFGKEKRLPLTVKLGVGNYESGHIHPTERINVAIQRQFKRLESTENISAIMNLDELSKLPELEDICVILRNKLTLDAICKMIAQNKEIVKTIRGIRLSKNGIITLSSL